MTLTRIAQTRRRLTQRLKDICERPFRRIARGTSDADVYAGPGGWTPVDFDHGGLGDLPWIRDRRR